MDIYGICSTLSDTDDNASIHPGPGELKNMMLDVIGVPVFHIEHGQGSPVGIVISSALRGSDLYVHLCVYNRQCEVFERLLTGEVASLSLGTVFYFEDGKSRRVLKEITICERPVDKQAKVFSVERAGLHLVFDTYKQNIWDGFPVHSKNYKTVEETCRVHGDKMALIQLQNGNID